MGAARPRAGPVAGRAVAMVPKTQEVAAAFAPPDVDVDVEADAEDVEDDEEEVDEDELAGAASDEEDLESAFFVEESPLPFDLSAVPERESLR